MNQSEEKIVETLTNVIVKIIDAKEEKNKTEENKKIALVDMMKLLNMTYSEIIKNKESDAKVIFNSYQQLYFRAVNQAHKQTRKNLRLIDIKNSIWRDYIISLFQKSEEGLLQKLTGWSVNKNLVRDKITPDMKIMFLSLNNIEKK